jgi:hypothetical protein
MKSFIKRMLCKVGIHKWQSRLEDYDILAGIELVSSKCKWCGKESGFIKDWRENKW